MKTKLLILSLATVLLPHTGCFAMTGQEIQNLINAATKAGSGEVIIPPGVHNIERGLLIKDGKNIRLTGADAKTCVLKLPSLAFAETAGDTPAGSERIITSRHQNLEPGMQLWIEAAGEIDSFTKKPKPYVLAFVKALGRDFIELRQPLKFSVPTKVLIRHADAPNLIEIRGASEGVQITKLTLDGGKAGDEPPVHGHAQLCGVFASGAYSYEKGPTGPKVKGVTVSHCIIRNCHGRGVAFYAVDDSRIEDCTITDTTDEAVDLDHFTTRVSVRRNQVARSGVGAELNDANDCVVDENEFRDCGIGINLWRFCKQPGLNEGNRITGNVFTGMKGNGVQIAKETAKNTVTGNTITGSGRNGISVGGAQQTIRDNRIEGSAKKDIAVTEAGAVLDH